MPDTGLTDRFTSAQPLQASSDIVHLDEVRKRFQQRSES